MKRTSLLSLFILLTLSVFGTVWHVNNNPGMVSDFQDLTSAFGSTQVLAGDTLYVYGSSVSYGIPASLTKRLTLIGPGYFLNQNAGLQYNINPVVIEQISLGEGSGGSLISGMNLNHCEVNANNVVIQRNKISRLLLNGANCIVLQNFFYDIPSYIAPLYIYDTATGSIIANNWIYRTYGDYWWSIYMEDSASGTFYNNITFGGCRFRHSEVYNSIISCDRPGWQWSFDFDSYSSLHHNVLMLIDSWDWTVSISGLGPGNIYNVNTQIYEETGSYDAYYQLCAGSVAIGAGVDGADCGIYGGSSPYRLSGIPAIPTISEFLAPATGFTIPVQITARSNN